MYVMHVCMYVCMHACMYACMHACMHVCISRKKDTVFLAFSQRGRPKTLSFPHFRQKDAGTPSQQKSRQAWDPCFATPAPRRLRLVERHQIAARYVGDPPPLPPPPPPLKKPTKYPTRRAMSADYAPFKQQPLLWAA